MHQKNNYFSQGFKFSRSVSVVDFIQTFNENKIVTGPRIKIYFKPGARTSDFKSQCNKISQYISFDSDKLLSPKRNLKLEAKVIKFNTHLIYIYDLDGRVINYLVLKGEDTMLLEDSKSTTWIVDESVAKDPEALHKIIYKSKYIKWEEIPCNEFYSYKWVNTTDAKNLEALKPRNSITGLGNGNSNNTGDIPTVINNRNEAIDYKSYTKWRLQYSTVLVGFYEAIQSQLGDEYKIYMDGKPIRCLDKNSSKKVDINLQGFGNMERHPWVYEHDLYQMRADLSIKINSTDQLEYMHFKKKYQNYEFLSNVANFKVKDKYGLEWTSHIWWERFQDSTNLRGARDEQGRFSHTLELRLSIHYYEVEDEYFKTIDQIRVVFQNLPEKPEYLYKLKDF